MFLKQQISILQWFLKDHVTLYHNDFWKCSFALQEKKYIFKSIKIKMLILICNNISQYFFGHSLCLNHCHLCIVVGYFGCIDQIRPIPACKYLNRKHPCWLDKLRVQMKDLTFTCWRLRVCKTPRNELLSLCQSEQSCHTVALQMSSGLMSSCANSKCHQHVATLAVSRALHMCATCKRECVCAKS